MAVPGEIGGQSGSREALAGGTGASLRVGLSAECWERRLG